MAGVAWGLDMIGQRNNMAAAPPRWTHRAPPSVMMVRSQNRMTGIPLAELMLTPEQREEERKERVLRFAMAHRALAALSEREHAVVTRHYGFHTGLPMALTDVAEDLDWSYNAVQKVHARALRTMREALGVKRKGLNSGN